MRNLKNQSWKLLNRTIKSGSNKSNRRSFHWIILLSFTGLLLPSVVPQIATNSLTKNIFLGAASANTNSELVAQAKSTEPTGQKKVFKIATIAKRGKDKTIEKWKPLADYLSETIPEYDFELVPMNFEEIYAAAEKSEFDFLLPNPGMYVDFEARYGANRIATLKNRRLGNAYTEFGAVIFTKADRNDINELKDFNGKTFMGVKEVAFGGWQMAWGVFEDNGINPKRQFKELDFAGTHDKVVMAVLNGETDGGTVRTDTIERMATEGKVKLEDFKIINNKQDPQGNFPFLISTPLYPEWPFASTKNVSLEISEIVAKALLNMPKDHSAAKAAKSDGWTVPLNYRPIHDLFIELSVTPYDEIEQITFEDLLWYWVAIAGILGTLAGVTIYFQRRSLIQTQTTEKSLNALNRSLEQSAKEQREEREALEEAISTLMDSLEPASEGDLTVRAQLLEGDVGIIADLFNAIVENLRAIAIQTKSSASHVSLSLSDNEVTIRELAEEAAVEAQQIQNTLSSVANISESIKEVADNAEKTASISNDAFATAQEGNKAMDLTVESIQGLRTTVGDTAKKIKRLGESAQQISQVVSLIDEIALKTNLLAINASVEAARAGELGQGFTAVAEQVGALAEQSANATKEISQLVQGIQSETQEVVAAMEVGTTQVVASTRLVEDTKTRLQAVLAKSQDIDLLMQSISKATVSQAATSQIVTETMKQVTEASSQRSQSSRQIAEAIKGTTNIVQELQESVAQFKVSEAEQQPEAKMA
ncbi:methyl-accepting chemotaxis protein [Xenococcus sp. PCC 7305]|uniref:PhnD/SsuA/transferrin family substrate-binding protein n=1 Tax=Xenococcus sp. PCC 7305 TaxID=102125 RepID=UPI0002AD193E|nr:PhnD/SsuA/transferrin family substrate-binding protein [Xenococcus sp. PCC 7305]ELS05165.1 methyl-accepting chemotaxis protein [Xenococcus sp. PCC 7305]